MIFNDMKILFDTTVKNFDEKVDFERTQVEERYAKILRDQRLVNQTYEQKYNLVVMKKLNNLESIINEFMLDKAKQTKDPEYTDDGLFPKNVTKYDEGLEKKIRESYLS